MDFNATLLIQMIVFFLWVIIVMKYIWPPVITAMKARQVKIAEGLAAAERGEHEHELAEQRAKELLKDAKQQASEIITQAQRRGNEVVEEAKEMARSEGERIKATAQAEIQQEVNRAKEVLRGQVVSIALAGTERILKREVNADSHKDILDELVSQV